MLSINSQQSSGDRNSSVSFPVSVIFKLAEYFYGIPLVDKKDYGMRNQPMRMRIQYFALLKFKALVITERDETVFVYSRVPNNRRFSVKNIIFNLDIESMYFHVSNVKPLVGN